MRSGETHFRGADWSDLPHLIIIISFSQTVLSDRVIQLWDEMSRIDTTACVLECNLSNMTVNWSKFTDSLSFYCTQTQRRKRGKRGRCGVTQLFTNQTCHFREGEQPEPHYSNVVKLIEALAQSDTYLERRSGFISTCHRWKILKDNCHFDRLQERGWWTGMVNYSQATINHISTVAHLTYIFMWCWHEMWAYRR